ncbi:hypothetical protein DH2020_020196 [Rehmannia glutinosa]|uniref:Myb-like domain-containing protein n=1 Tax=Rehmannia glutinosa TaxID=99300 RepID=A0ABR0WFJ3_REHGL
MASSSGAYKEGSNKQGQQGCYNGNSVHGEWGVPTFQHQQTISMDWTPEEQALLEEGLSQYATESNIIRYAKIAVQLKNKTVRDVALRCRWMTAQLGQGDPLSPSFFVLAAEYLARGLEELFSQKPFHEKVTDSLAKPSRLAIQSGLSHAPGMVSNCNDDSISYNDIGGATRQLLQQNAWAFKQISANLATHQIRENICLLSQARDNIFKILSNLNDMGPTMKKMPPLPKVNEVLANSILQPTTFQIQ